MPDQSEMAVPGNGGLRFGHVRRKSHTEHFQPVRRSGRNREEEETEKNSYRLHDPVNGGGVERRNVYKKNGYW